MAFHDPEGAWGRRDLHLAWTSTGPDGTERIAVELDFLPREDRFAMRGSYRASRIDYACRGDVATATFDGAAPEEAEARARALLEREDGLFWRNYFGFLAGLPMSLAGPGAYVAPEATAEELEGRAVTALRVTFDPAVGADLWDLFVDPESGRVLGARFFHDESAGDGEYLAFDELLEVGGMRLPAVRRWYVNADGAFLGTDTLAAREP